MLTYVLLLWLRPARSRPNLATSLRSRSTSGGGIRRISLRFIEPLRCKTTSDVSGGQNLLVGVALG